MIIPLIRVRFFTSLVVLVGGCVPPQMLMAPGDVRMVDPRTGIVTVCPAGQATIDPARSDLAKCIAEMRFYGFGIEQELVAAHGGPPGGAPPQVATVAPEPEVTMVPLSRPAYVPPRPAYIPARPIQRVAAPDPGVGSASGRPWYAPDGAPTPLNP